MLRHATAPARFFSQVPNEIIRHPRLSSDAVRLLAWQLSLPDGADEPLSRTAERAGIKKGAFLRAKRELKTEGYLHEWRRQGARGLWATVQLVSNVPLTAEEAVWVRDGAPADDPPAAGQPTGRAAGRHPENTLVENTSHHPAPVVSPSAEARRVVEGLDALDPRLRVPRGMLPQLAALAAEWLACGHTVGSVRDAIRRGLPGQGRAIHRPGGLVRHVLRDVAPAPADPPRPRVAEMRECAGAHVQPRLFRPVADEKLCGECRQDRAEADGTLVTARGAAAARAALLGSYEARVA
ncbi:hypothetical protein GCM10020367_07320 [Streptomyces sannanensis]|uniref:MarR family transcriptional regulator n=1 Tax=Streptomyces sannanensis TaxID=285536 RepID=A0ABP6S579_9ACTN